jgi:ABC-2 type transport system permease protein
MGRGEPEPPSARPPRRLAFDLRLSTFDLYFRLVGARLRGQTQYRVSFALQVASSFTATFVELLAVLILFRTFHDLAGWSVGEVAFLYGLASIALALTELFGSGFERVSPMIKEGEFDRVLTRPVPAFVQVLAADLQLRKIGRVAQGLFALVLAQRWAAIEWTAPKAALFVAALGSTMAVFFAVFLIGAAVCFWTIENSEAQNIFTYGGTELASNPLQIYSRWLQGIFLYIVPLGLTSFYPATYILGKPDPLGLPPFVPFIAPLVAAAFLGVGLMVWGFGLRHYQSTGS